MMQNNQIERLDSETARIRQDCAEMNFIVDKCRQIVKKINSNENNNLILEIHKVYGHSMEFSAILGMKALWEEWIIIVEQQKTGFLYEVIVYKLKKELYTDILEFYKKAESATNKYVQKFQMFTTKHAEPEGLSTELKSFCSHVEEVIKKIEIFHKRLQVLKQYKNLGVL